MGTAEQEVERWHSAALQRLNCADLVGARAACLEVLAVAPEHADAHFLLGMVAASARRYGEACTAIERALILDATRSDYHAQHARCLASLKHDGEARAAAEHAESLAPRDALTLDTLGVVWSRLGDHDRAVAAFRRAVAEMPSNADFHYNLAASLRILGRFDEAERALEAVIGLAPRAYRAHSALAELRKQTAAHNHVARLEVLLDGVGDDVDGELHLRHALAKELEDLGEYPRAFAHLTAGKVRKRATLDYTIADDEALFAAIERVLDGPRCAAPPAGCPSREPIFVVGLPRSGTTLVERILSAHSHVQSAGELQNFGLALKRAAATSSNRVLDAQTIEQAARCDLAAVGQTYIDSTRPLTGKTPRFVDKLPLNFFYVGFIHFALPHAKIVCLRRQPLDSCLSLYRQLFAVAFSSYNFTYDLGDIGRYYVLFDRLLAHWQRVLPGKVLEVSYEALVAEQEPTTRALLEFCGLPWEARCLDFHTNAAPVATASSVQVRAPLYGTAVGRWRRYAAQLEPLIAQLRAAGIPLE
ncbi:MAG: sulfotransferase [Gammaproteobacteria bacterium]